MMAQRPTSPRERRWDRILESTDDQSQAEGIGQRIMNGW